MGQGACIAQEFGALSPRLGSVHAWGVGGELLPKEWGWVGRG